MPASMDSDDEYKDMDGGKKKYATDKERTNDKYGDEAHDPKHDMKGDEKYAEGMNKKQRRCQDIICLIIFIAYVGGMIFMTVYGFIHGDVKKLLAPLDGNQMFCGIKNGLKPDEDLTDYPYLYIGDLLEATIKASAGDIGGAFSTGVCVSTCPHDVGNAKNGVIAVKCKIGTSLCTKATNSGQHYSSVNVAGMCIPPSEKYLTTKQKAAYKIVASEIKSSAGGKAIGDIIKALPSIYWAIGTGFIFGLLLLYLMSEYATIIAWLCIILTMLGLFGGAILCWFMRTDVIQERGKPGSGTAVQGADENDSETEAFWLLVGTIGLAAVGCCFCLCVFCFYKHVAQAIEVIDAAADFAVENKRVIAVPILYFVLTMVSFFVWLYSFACVVALNPIKAGSGAIPQDRDVEWKGYLWTAALGMVFGILWIMAWWTYSAKFVIMAAATTYYFNSDAEHEGQAEVWYSFKLAHIYHTGSIAAGAFIIALIEFIKLVFMYLAKKAEKASGGNKCIKAVVCVAECVLSCIEKICDYINQAAFAYIAVTGDGFCEGAWKGFLLNVKYMLDFTFANYIAKIFILLGKLTLTIVNSFMLVFIMKQCTGIADELHSIWGPIFVSALISYITASLFLGIFENAVLALMTCLAVDMDLHDGVPKFGPAPFHDAIEKVKARNVADSQVDDSDDEKNKASAMK